MTEKAVKNEHAQALARLRWGRMSEEEKKAAARHAAAKANDCSIFLTGVGNRWPVVGTESYPRAGFAWPSALPLYRDCPTVQEVPHNHIDGAY